MSPGDLPGQEQVALGHPHDGQGVAGGEGDLGALEHDVGAHQHLQGPARRAKVRVTKVPGPRGLVLTAATVPWRVTSWDGSSCGMGGRPPPGGGPWAKRAVPVTSTAWINSLACLMGHLPEAKMAAERRNGPGILPTASCPG